MFRNLITILVFTVATLVATSVTTAQPGDTGTAEAPTAAAPTIMAQPVVDLVAPTGVDPAATEAATPASAAAEAAAPAPAAEEPASAKAEAPKDATAPKDASKEAEAVVKEDDYPFTDVTPDSYWMPARAAGNTTDHVDWMFYAILGLSVFCFFAITVAVVYLTWRYRHRPGHRAEPSTAHDNVLEVVWTVIPSIICVFIFIGGWKGYLNMTTAPGDALEIQTVGQKWNWTFTYSKGLETISRPELHVPVNRPVKLNMRSEDVLHSFYLPSMRVKQDVIPNRYSYIWFEADTPGVYKVYCAEYCGDAHSDMKTKVVVHERGGYEKWLNDEYEKDQVDCREFEGQERQDCYIGQGQKIYEAKGCKQCHSLDGSSGTGPTFQGMWGQTRSFTDGSSGTVDENYVRESVLDPMAKIRSGFSPVMPTFKGKLKDKDIDALNNWMKAL